MKLRITQKLVEKARMDLISGLPRTKFCPVAQAIKGDNKTALAAEAWVNGKKYIYPERLRKQVRNFDSGGKFEPGIYELIPDA